MQSKEFDPETARIESYLFQRLDQTCKRCNPGPNSSRVLIELLEVSSAPRGKAVRLISAREGEPVNAALVESADWDLSTLQAKLPRHVKTGSMRYSDFRQLGTGGKAEVFRCLDETLRRKVAYKVLHHSLMNSEMEQQMLVREARMMASLDHPCIPVVHDLGRDYHARPYFTMSLAAGRTMYDRYCSSPSDVVDSADAPLEDLLGQLLEVGETLEYAHQQGVVHNDIKPENVIVGAQQGTQLIDWGLSALCSVTEGHDTPIDELWGCQGSPLHMAPERAAGSCSNRPSSDIYSFGVLVYECLTGQPPIKGETSRETLQMLAETRPVPPSEVAPNRGILPRLDQVCLQALEKSPSDRFQTMGELVATLRDCRLDFLINFERT